MLELVNLLLENNYTIGSVESLTGGMFASEIVGISGASQVYLGSIVSYANSVKEGLLEIDESIIKDYGVISEQVVRLMCDAGARLLNVDVTISFSGNAGPGVLDNKPQGAIYSCIKILNDYYVYYDELNGSRNEIRKEIVDISVSRLKKILKEG